jgi:hypothetical protein
MLQEESERDREWMATKSVAEDSINKKELNERFSEGTPRKKDSGICPTRFSRLKLSVDNSRRHRRKQKQKG